MIINEANYGILEKAKKITLYDYEIKWFNAENIDGYIEPEQMLNMIEDLICEIDGWKEKYEDLMRDIENNYEYKPEPDPDCER